MQQIKKVRLIELMVITLLFSVIMGTRVYADTYENYIADKPVTTLKPGDEIFFDNSETNWSDVGIYIFGNDGEYKSWNNSPAMTQISGTDMWKFVVPYDLTVNKYKKVIFRNRSGSGSSNQTIDLGFIESGFGYKIDGTSSGKRIGYWYVYDKESIVQHLQSSLQYQTNKAKYTESSYSNLDELLTQAATAVEGEIRVYAYKDSSGNDINSYYISIAPTLKQIDNIISNLQIDKRPINITNDGNGTVTTDQSDNTQIPVGTSVTLSITPNETYEIDQITIKDSNDNDVIATNNTFTMPKSDVTINATFKKVKKSITLSTENGNVSTNQSDNSMVNIGDTVSLTLTPNQGYELDTLTVTDEAGTSIPVTSNTFVMPNSNVTITTRFKEQIITKNITIASTQNGSVSTSVGPEAIANNPVTITAIPNYGYELDTIRVVDETGTEIPVTDNTFTMPTSNVEITVTFKNIKKSVTLNGSVGGTVSTNQANNSQVNVGDTVTIVATPNEYYEIDTIKVTDEAGAEITVINNTFTMPNSNVNTVVTYKRITKAITVTNSANGTTTINADDLKKINAGETVKITTTPNAGYEVGDIVVTDDEGNRITVSPDGTFIMPKSNVTINTVFKQIGNSTSDTTSQNSGTSEETAEEATKTENQSNQSQAETAVTTDTATTSESTATTATQGETTNLTSAPKTGDYILVYVSMFIISIVGIITMVIIKKRK